MADRLEVAAAIAKWKLTYAKHVHTITMRLVTCVIQRAGHLEEHHISTSLCQNLDQHYLLSSCLHNAIEGSCTLSSGSAAALTVMSA